MPPDLPVVARGMLMRIKSPQELFIEIISRHRDAEKGKLTGERVYFGTDYNLSKGLKYTYELGGHEKGKHPIRIERESGEREEYDGISPIEILMIRRKKGSNPELTKKYELVGGKVEFEKGPANYFSRLDEIAKQLNVETREEIGIKIDLEWTTLLDDDSLMGVGKRPIFPFYSIIPGYNASETLDSRIQLVRLGDEHDRYTWIDPQHALHCPDLITIDSFQTIGIGVTMYMEFSSAELSLTYKRENGSPIRLGEFEKLYHSIPKSRVERLIKKKDYSLIDSKYFKGFMKIMSGTN